MPFATASNNAIRITGTETIESLYADAVNTGWLQRQGHAGFYSYYNAERRLVVRSGANFTIANCLYSGLVNGSTTDTERRKLVICESGGVLNIGEPNVARSVTRFTDYRTFITLWSENNWNNQAWQENSSVLFADGGEINLYGATVNYHEGQIRIDSGGVIRFRNATIYSDSLQTSLAQTSRIVNVTAGTIDIDGLRVSSAGNWELNTQGTVTQALRYEPTQVSLAFHGTSNQLSEAVLIDGAGDANGADCSVQNNGNNGQSVGAYPYFQVIDHAAGNAIAFSTKGIVTGNTQNAAGLIEGKINVVGRCVDPAAAAVSGVGVFLLDTDNGNRGNSLTGSSTQAHPQTGIVYDDDQEYAAATDAQGDFALLPLINLYDRRTTSNPTTELPTDIRTPFLQRVRLYGKQFIEQTLDTDQPVSQLFTIRDNGAVTQTEAAALAHAGITVTDHASPVAWQGLSWGLTIQANAGAVTADDIYHHLQARLSALTAVWEGKTGGAWHELVLPGFETQTGQYGGARVTKGVRVIDENGDAFPGFSRFQSDSGAYYTPPTSVSYTLTGLQPNTEVRVYATTAGSGFSIGDEVAGVESSGASFSFNYTHSGDFNADIVIHSLGFVHQRVSVTLTASDATLPVQQRVDRNYSNP